MGEQQQETSGRFLHQSRGEMAVVWSSVVEMEVVGNIILV